MRTRKFLVTAAVTVVAGFALAIAGPAGSAVSHPDDRTWKAAQDNRDLSVPQDNRDLSVSADVVWSASPLTRET